MGRDGEPGDARGGGGGDGAPTSASGGAARHPGAGGPPADPDSLLELAVEVAGRAVRLLAGGVARARASVETKSSATDMVSEMDRAAERLIVDALLAARPGDGIVAEEGSARAGTSGLRWVVDPLDGTTNYLYGHPGWAVSIAAEDEAGVLVGVVADGVHGEVFTAVRGGGARRDGEPIACSGADDLRRALVGTGFGYAPERRQAQGALVAGLLPRVRDIRRMGAAAVDLCSVACGRLDAYYEHGLAWWDLAAGSLVATEAGAVVGPLGDAPLRAGSVVAAAPAIAGPLRDLLTSLGAQKVP